jgi:hypothetical protein
LTHIVPKHEKALLCIDEAWRRAVYADHLLNTASRQPCHHGAVYGTGAMERRKEPRLKPSKPAIGIVTPAGHAMLVNVLLGSPPLTLDSPLPAMMSGAIAFRHTLRSGDLVLVLTRAQPMSKTDTAMIIETRAKMKATSATPVDPSTRSAEAVWFSGNAVTGNVIAVIPAGAEIYTNTSVRR